MSKVTKMYDSVWKVTKMCDSVWKCCTGFHRNNTVTLINIKTQICTDLV